MLQVFNISRWFGIAGANRYYWKLWGVLLIVVLTVVEIGAIWKVVKALAGWAVNTTGHRSVTARLAGATLYANAVLSIILSWKLSSSWGKISDLWILLERALATSGIPADKNLELKMTTVNKFFIFCGFVEHMMSIISTIGFNCPPSLWLKKYILDSHGFLLQPSDYSISVGIFLIVLSTVATILWNLQDLVLILITMGLASRYRRINKHVAVVCNKNKKQKDNSNNSETLNIKQYTWRKIREAYVKQAMLVRKVNDALGALILLSNSCNFYFTCLQLFLGITQGMSDTGLKQVYYLLSFIWLCIRTTLVVLSAADVNICSKGALPYLFDCRTRFYNLEIERLQYQLSKDFVALSGMGFFFLTKSLLLQTLHLWHDITYNILNLWVTTALHVLAGYVLLWAGVWLIIRHSIPSFRHFNNYNYNWRPNLITLISMAGAVITYELVLIQFDDTDRSTSDYNYTDHNSTNTTML